MSIHPGAAPTQPHGAANAWRLRRLAPWPGGQSWQPCNWQHQRGGCRALLTAAAPATLWPACNHRLLCKGGGCSQQQQQQQQQRGRPLRVAWVAGRSLASRQQAGGGSRQQHMGAGCQVLGAAHSAAGGGRGSGGCTVPPVAVRGPLRGRYAASTFEPSQMSCNWAMCWFAVACLPATWAGAPSRRGSTHPAH